MTHLATFELRDGLGLSQAYRVFNALFIFAMVRISISMHIRFNWRLISPKTILLPRLLQMR